MVDTFLFLTIARTGDQLQGIKKGILEISDVVAVNKADPTDTARQMEARAAARELAGAMRLVRGMEDWNPPVVTASGLADDGVDGVWDQVLAHRAHLGETGVAEKRAHQQLDFTWALVRDELEQRLRHNPHVREIRDQISADLLAGELAAPMAADRLLEAFDRPADAGPVVR
jgi:LAO/AO transport system kinase